MELDCIVLQFALNALIGFAEIDDNIQVLPSYVLKHVCLSPIRESGICPPIQRIPQKAIGSQCPRVGLEQGLVISKSNRPNATWRQILPMRTAEREQADAIASRRQASYNSLPHSPYSHEERQRR